MNSEKNWNSQIGNKNARYNQQDDLLMLESVLEENESPLLSSDGSQVTPVPKISKLNLLWHLTQESFKNKLFTLFLIIFFMSGTVIITVLLLSITNIFPVMIYKSEIGARDKSDLKVFTTNSFSYMNFSNIQKAIADLPEVTAAPRLYKLCYINNASSSSEFEPGTRGSSSAQGLMSLTALPLVLLDQQAEEKMKFSDGLKPLRQGEVALVGEMAREGGISAGDFVSVLIKDSKFEEKMFKKWNKENLGNELDTSELGSYWIKVKVAQLIEDVSYRMTLKLGSGLIADINTFQQHMIPFRKLAFGERSDFSDYLMNFNLSHYSSFIKFRLGSPKDIYYFNDQSKMRKEFNRRVNQVTSRLPEDMGLSFQSEIVERMQEKERILNLLGIFFIGVLGFTLLLAAYIISNVYSRVIYDRKTDISILRAQGMTINSLSLVYLFQSLIIAILSILIAIIPLGRLFELLNDMFFQEVTEDSSIGYSKIGLLLGFIFTIIIPFVSTIKPLLEVTQDSIISGIDSRRSNNTASSIEVEQIRHEESYSNSTITCSILAVLYGISLYIGMPYSLLKGDLFLISIIIVILFISTGLGICFIFMGILPAFDWVCRGVLYFEREFVSTIVMVNTKTHRYFSIPTIVAMIISITSVTIFGDMIGFFRSTTVESDYRSQGGRFVMIGNFNYGNLGYQYQIARSEYDVAVVSRALEDWSATSVDHQKLISERDGFYNRIQAGTIGGMVKLNDKVRAVTPNYATVSNYKSFAKLGSFSRSTSLTPFEYLYTRFGHGSLIMSSSSQNLMGIRCDQGEKSFIALTLDSRFIGQTYYKTPCSASFDRLPGVYIRDFLYNKENQEMVIDFLAGTALLDSRKTFEVQDIPIWKYMVSPKVGEFDENQMEYLKEMFTLHTQGELQRRYLLGGKDKQVLENPKEDFMILVRFLEISIYLLMAVRLIYGLSQIFIRQKKPMGILMSLGLNPYQLARIYFYEVYILILTAGMISFLLITILNFTFGMQMMASIDVVYRLKFPWSVILGAVVYGILLALFSAGIPVFFMVRDNMNKLLREYE